MGNANKTCVVHRGDWSPYVIASVGTPHVVCNPLQMDFIGVIPTLFHHHHKEIWTSMSDMQVLIQFILTHQSNFLPLVAKDLT